MTGPRGFTLIEGVVASAVLAVAVVALSASLSAGHMASYEFTQGRRAARLAEELLEYMLSLPYYDPGEASAPGPEVGEVDVRFYDNVDDFHGYVEAGSELRDMAGNEYPAEYQDFTRSVTVEAVVETVSGLGDPISGLMVRVEVRSSRGRVWDLTRFVAAPVGS